MYRKAVCYHFHTPSRLSLTVSASGAPSVGPSAGHSRVPSDAAALPTSTSSGNIAGGAGKDASSAGVKGEGELADGVASMGIADGEVSGCERVLFTFILPSDY